VNAVFSTKPENNNKYLIYVVRFEVGYHGADCKDYCLVACDDVYFGK